MRFGVVGALATAIHALFASIYLVTAHGSALIANLLGFAASFAWSFAGNAWWVFRFEGSLLAVFPRFLAFSVGGLALSTAISLATDRAGLNPFWALGMVVMTIPALSFLANRTIVFR